MASEENNCDPSYQDTCIPPKTTDPESDLNCENIPNRDFKTSSTDSHDFDRDGDGIGCESGNNNDDAIDQEINCNPSYQDTCIPPKTTNPESDSIVKVYLIEISKFHKIKILMDSTRISMV